MTDRPVRIEEGERSLFTDMVGFLRDQFQTRDDFALEDKYRLEVAIQYLKRIYGLEEDFNQNRFSRPLLDVFQQLTNPVSVQEKIRADVHKDEGNNYMRRKLFTNAEPEYTSAIKLDKWNSIYYANRASARIGQRRYLDAIEDCRHALTLNPDYAKAHARMGQAYTLTTLADRHTKALHCFHRALELEPENESYRQNLASALNHNMTRVTTNLAGSLFGFGSQNVEGRSAGIFPATFVIITENHLPISSTSFQAAERAARNTKVSQIPQSTRITENHTQTNEISRTTFNEMNNVATDKGKKEQSALTPSTRNEYRKNTINPRELVIDTPLARLSFSFGPTTQPLPPEADSSLQNTEITHGRSPKRLNNNVPSPESQHESEKKSKSLENARPTLPGFKESSRKLVQKYRKSCSSAEQNDDSERNAIQANIDPVKKKTTDEEQKEVVKEETVLTSGKDSSNNTFTKKQN